MTCNAETYAFTLYFKVLSMSKELAIEGNPKITTGNVFSKLTIKRELKMIRKLVLFFIVMLFLSGLTAIPIDAELT